MQLKPQSALYLQLETWEAWCRYNTAKYKESTSMKAEYLTLPFVTFAS